MKEKSRQRIVSSLEQLQPWRSSGMGLSAYAQSQGQSASLWRGWLTWEVRGR